MTCEPDQVRHFSRKRHQPLNVIHLQERPRSRSRSPGRGLLGLPEQMLSASRRGSLSSLLGVDAVSGAGSRRGSIASVASAITENLGNMVPQYIHRFFFVFQTLPSRLHSFFPFIDFCSLSFWRDDKISVPAFLQWSHWMSFTLLVNGV